MTKPSLSDYGTYDESTVPRLWDGVVGAWCPSLGPTGTRLHDFSRFNNWGTLTNMDAATDWVVSDGQYSLDFDGSNDEVAMATIPLVDTASGLTFSCWYYPRVTTGLPALMNQFSGAFGSYLFAIGTSLCWQVGNSSNARITATSVITATNRWYHLVGAKLPSTIEAFANGLSVGSASFSGTQTSSGATFRLGGTVGGLNVPDGLLDDVKVWSRALTPNEVRELYLLGRGGMFQRRRVRRGYVSEAAVRSYLFVNRGQVIGGGTL